MKLHRFVSFCTLIAAGFSLGVGQRSPDFQRHEGRPESQTPVFVEARTFISSVAGKSRLAILYRIPERFFVAVHNPSGTQSARLVLRPEISVEILDKGGSAVARDLRRDDVGTTEDTTETPDRRFLEGGFQFDISPGEYSLVFEVNDRESSRHYVDNKRKVSVRDFSKSPLALTDILFLQPELENAPPAAVNYGGDLPLGRNAECYVEARTRATQDSFSLSYNLYREQPGNRLPLQARSISAPPGFSAMLSLEKGGQDLLTWKKILPAGVQPFHFSIRTDTLPEGEYVLELIAARGHDTVRKTEMFQVRWFDKPFTLRNLERAIDALRYIAGEDELGNMRHANADAQRRLFDDFWKKRDTMPATAYNKVMAEYYRRADHAAMHFGTLRNADGIETDRGKAYLLYGPPTRVSRQMKPSVPPREVWEYDSLKKRLIFVDENHRGEYVLLTTEDR